MKYRIEIETLEVHCDFLSEIAELLKPENWERLTVTRLDAEADLGMYGEPQVTLTRGSANDVLTVVVPRSSGEDV